MPPSLTMWWTQKQRPLNSFPRTWMKTFNRSNGAVNVRDTAPAKAPATKCFHHIPLTNSVSSDSSAPADDSVKCSVKFSAKSRSKFSWLPWLSLLWLTGVETSIGILAGLLILAVVYEVINADEAVVVSESRLWFRAFRPWACWWWKTFGRKEYGGWLR